MRRFLIPAVLALTACDPTWLDSGLMVRDGVELRAPGCPQYVAVDDTMPAAWMTSSVDWWNAQAGRAVLAAADPEGASIWLSVGFVSEEDALEQAHVDYAADGTILRCEVVVSSDIAYDEPTALQALRHGLGHCLGLDDDPGPPETVDLRSIMSSPLDPLGELTEHDRQILAEEVCNASL